MYYQLEFPTTPINTFQQAITIAGTVITDAECHVPKIR